jgi:anti-sigma factor RsiW
VLQTDLVVITFWRGAGPYPPRSIMDCSHCQEHLISYHLGELDERTAREVEAELEQCAACSQALVSIQQTLAAVAELPDVEPPTSIRQDVLRAARLALDRPEKLAWWQSQGFALAASVLIVAGAGWLSLRIATGPNQAPAESTEVVAAAGAARVDSDEQLPVPLEEAVRRSADPAPAVDAPMAEAPADEPQAAAAPDLQNQLDLVGENRQSNVELTEREAPSATGREVGEPLRTQLEEERTSARAPAARSTSSRTGGADVRNRGSVSTDQVSLAEPSVQQAQGLRDLSGTPRGAAESGASDQVAAARSAAQEEQQGGALSPIDADDAERAGIASPTTLEEGRARGDVNTVTGLNGRGLGGGFFDDVLVDSDLGEGGAESAPERAQEYAVEEDFASADEARAEGSTGRRSRSERRGADSRSSGSGAPPATSPASAVDSAEAGEVAVSDALFAAALSDYDAGRAGAAVTRFARFLQESSPSDGRRGDATYLMGAAQIRRGQTDEGGRTLRQFLARYPGHSRTADANALLRSLSRGPDSTRDAPGSPASLEQPQ